LFIQSLYSKSLRTTLVTSVDIKEIRNVNLVIKKSINLKEGARLAEKDDQAQHSNQSNEYRLHVTKEEILRQEKCFQAFQEQERLTSKLVNCPNSMTSTVIQSVDIIAIMNTSITLIANTTSIK
jgi:hypothetical protein